MKFFTSSLLSILLVSLLHTPVAVSQEATADQCVDTLQKEVSREHRVFRAILFGSKKAEDSSVGTVKYETDGSAWYKINGTEWRSLDEGFENTTHFNDLIDQRSDIAQVLGGVERKGILETKRMTTSELIPYVGSSLRVFQCRLHQLCDKINKSKEISGDQPEIVTAQYPGCVDRLEFSVPACHIDQKRPTTDSDLILQNCDEAIKTLLDQEAEVVNLVIQYDAAYRTLLQFAGSMDLLLQELNWPLTHTLQQTTDLIGILGRIPCYLSSCDAFPPPEE